MIQPLLLLLLAVVAQVDPLAAAFQAQRRGDDPAAVMRLFDEAIKANPDSHTAYLAAGDYALQLRDFKIAADQYQAGLERFPGSADLARGLAESLLPSDPAAAMGLLLKTRSRHPTHIPTLMLIAEQQFDGEQHDAMNATLNQILLLRPDHSQAWALRAADAFVRGDMPKADAARKRALLANPTDPRTDHFIGLKLARRYRFEDAINFQQQALRIKPDFHDARLELAVNMLRINRNPDEAWRIIHDVQKDDPYNVTAYNLVTLHDQFDRFATLQRDGVVLRMPRNEAEVYGEQALQWLIDARNDMSERYDTALPGSVVVEVYSDQRDFAVRAFGTLGGNGLFGVCFGPVITARSGSDYRPGLPNWKSVLWHEFGHTVALKLSNHRVPRWFTEGLSVYEQWRIDADGGVQMNVTFKQWIEGGEMTPIADFNSAFLRPASGQHMMFAYFQAGLLLEHIVQAHGFDAVLAVLRDLAADKPINAALAARVAPLDELQASFDAFARKRAAEFAPRLDLEAPHNVEPTDVKALTAWLDDHPNSYIALSQLARHHASRARWAEAREVLERLVDLAGEPDTMLQLADVYAKLNEPDLRIAILRRAADRSDNASPAFLELMRLADDPADARRYARNYLAVNPMLAEAYDVVAQRSVELGDHDAAVTAMRSLLAIGPADPADAHYRMALLLVDDEPAAAKRHVLDALTYAPRYADAQQLLLKLVEGGAP